MLSLIKILVDIICFRSGPDALPRSPIIFIIMVTMWLAADLFSIALNPELGISHLLTTLIVGIPGLVIYAVIVQINGKGDRNQQMLSAVIGCSALFGIVMSIFIALALGTSEDGAAPILTLLLLWAIALWAVSVDGHILATTLNFPRAYGFAVAMVVFVFQIYLSDIVSNATRTAY